MTPESGDKQPLPQPDSWNDRLRQRISGLKLRRVNHTPGTMEIMFTSIIQVLENRLKRNRMADDPPDMLLQPFCPQISTLDFHRAEEAIDAGRLSVEKKIDKLLPLVRDKQQ